ncbi:MAG: T9SS type A sorting domain-containing protein [Lewinellaceae bacterium]|nr:T9SS type A sorting domain-containing protein [Lewinellaceae bacterium]
MSANFLLRYSLLPSLFLFPNLYFIRWWPPESTEYNRQFSRQTDYAVLEQKTTGSIQTETSAPIKDVFVYMAQYENDGTCNNTSCPPDTMLTNSAGEFQFCTCEVCNDYIVTPYKNNDPLNGVSTFDLVLINKHILGLEFLNSPYKMIAADATKNNALQTSDIITLRRLILGLDTEFPNNTSWRFIQEDFNFPYPSNPFWAGPSTYFPETDSVPPSTINFIGIKVGDVNGNAVTHSRPGDRPVTTLTWPARFSRGSKTLTVPVQYTGTEPLEAIQLGLRFDPAVLQLISPSQGDLPATTAGNFGLVKALQGEIRMLWLPDGAEPDQYILPGAVLFYLSFEVTGPIPESGLPLQLDHNILESLAWRPDALEYQLQSDPLPAESRNAADNLSPRLRASCRPNPTTSEAVFHIVASEAGPGRIALFDAFGKLVFMRKVSLQAGEQDIPAPEVAQAPAGVYVWKVYAGGEKISGHLIRQ